MGGTGNSDWNSGNSNMTGGESKGNTSKSEPTATEKEIDRVLGIKRGEGESKHEKKPVYKSAETLAHEAKDKERKAGLKAMTPSARAEKLARDKFMSKKAGNYFKKTGKIPTAIENKKWDKDYKNYKVRQDAKTWKDSVRMFGEKQAKAHRPDLYKRVKANEAEAKVKAKADKVKAKAKADKKKAQKEAKKEAKKLRKNTKPVKTQKPKMGKHSGSFRIDTPIKKYTK